MTHMRDRVYCVLTDDIRMTDSAAFGEAGDESSGGDEMREQERGSYEGRVGDGRRGEKRNGEDTREREREES